jgi:hypothetical protein
LAAAGAVSGGTWKEEDACVRTEIDELEVDFVGAVALFFAGADG